jgi:hypothetical protein
MSQKAVPSAGMVDIKRLAIWSNLPLTKIAQCIGASEDTVSRIHSGRSRAPLKGGAAGLVLRANKTFEMMASDPPRFVAIMRTAIDDVKVYPWGSTEPEATSAFDVIARRICSGEYAGVHGELMVVNERLDDYIVLLWERSALYRLKELIEEVNREERRLYRSKRN